jgi:hypothetical protein
MYVSDFDRNGAPEQIFAIATDDGSEYPLTLKHELVMQMPSLKKSYLKFKDYNDQRIDQIFTANQLKSAVRKQVTELRSAILLNGGDGTYEWLPLPAQAQLSPVYACNFADVDSDGMDDIILGGNLYRVKPEAGRYDASRGLILRNLGGGNFDALDPTNSGLLIEGEVRNIHVLDDMLLIVRNNARPVVFTY